MKAKTYKTTISSAVIGLFVLLMLSPAVAIAQFAGGDGSAVSPWEISTPAHLNDVRNFLAAGNHFVLTDDITFDAADFQPGGDFHNGGEGWLPIGNSANEFRATFNGAGFAIDGLVINSTSTADVGLFGRIGNGSSVQNLIIRNANLTANQSESLGAIVGFVVNEAIVSNNEVVNSSVTGNLRVGGVAGRVNNIQDGQFANNHSSASVFGLNRVGGLVGSISNSSSIINSSSTGTVTLLPGGFGHVGGLVGRMENITKIETSYSTAQIFASNSSGGLERGIGGLVGSLFVGSTLIENTYAVTTITIADRSENNLSIGGLVGRMEGATVRSSFASTTMNFDTNQQSSRTGGLIGSFSLSLPINAVQASYWDINVSGLQRRGIDLGTDRTTQQLKSRSFLIAADWDFTNVWQNSRGTSYPFLRGVSKTVFAGPEIGRISNSEAWRHLGASLQGLTYNDLLGSIWTQGVPGSNNPSSLNPNIFTYSIVDNGWVPLQNMANGIPLGVGFAVYVFEADFENQPIDEQGFPKSIIVEGTLVTDDYTAPIHPLKNGWSMVANSFLFPINWADVYAVNAGNIDPNVYVYDSRVADPGYRVWNAVTNTGSSRLNGHIAAFQGFFVKTDIIGGPGSMTFPATAQRTNNESNLLTRSPLDFVASLDLSAQLVGKERERNVQVVFSSFDTSHGLALKPMDAVPFIEFAVLNTNDNTLNALFNVYQPEGSYTFPLILRNLEFNNNGWYEESAEFVLSWDGIDNFPADWQFLITDSVTGSSFDLRNTNSAVVQTEIAQLASENPVAEWTLLPQVSTSSPDEVRFYLTVVAGSPVNIGENTDTPMGIALEQNYPNPFNPVTNIRFSLNEGADVRLEVFNLMGQRVATLQDGFKQAGSHTVAFDAVNLSSGVYIYRLQAAGQVLTRKMTLVK